MANNVLRYDRMVEDALRGVLREALRASVDGLPGDHHFYITFRTRAPGAIVPKYLLTTYPEEMTIVLQHQFRALEIERDSFSVSLSFSSRLERLTVPFAAVTTFADPSVSFGLQFEAPAAKPAEVTALPGQLGAPEAVEPERPAAEIVTLDKFRKR